MKIFAPLAVYCSNMMIYFSTPKVDFLGELGEIDSTFF
jgi:hypothetical protein